MSFPVTINASVGGAEQPGRFAIFLNGADRYQVQFLLDIPDSQAQLVVYKSTDGGATWASADAAHGPEISYGISGGNNVTYSVEQISSTVLKVVYIDTLGAIQITSFTMGGSPAWSGASTAASSPPVFPGANGEPGGSGVLLQIATGFRSLDNSIIAVLVGDQVTLNNVPHALCVFAVYSIGGDSWSGWTDLGYLDYSDITTWDMVPCGIAVDDASGRATVFMQQIARAGPGFEQTVPFSASGAWNAPLDAPTTAQVQVFGDGGGSGGTLLPTDSGSGAGGGEYAGGTVTIAPGGSYPVVVGPGGAVLSGGTGSSVLGISANGGSPGTTDTGGGGVPGGAGGTGGSGGSVRHPGGAGGASGDGTGGGGGGVAGPTGAGGAGGPGDTGLGFFGGAPGAAADIAFPGDGGGGGNRGAANPPNNGSGGGVPGGGGGGQGDSSDGQPNNGVGGAGQVNIIWIPVRNTHDCRIFQQAILADNSLGTLTEITEAAFPSRSRVSTPTPISFDCASRNGKIWIAFTGANSTTGLAEVSAGQGTSADPVSFSFQNFSSGNGGNDNDATPALALGTSVGYCCYLSVPTGGPATFNFRADSGSGFGSPTAIGSLALPDVRAFGRIQAAVLSSLPEITFGTPTIATLELAHPT